MRITPEIREDAALICAIAASGAAWLSAEWASRWSLRYDRIRDELDVGQGALSLAICAWLHVMQATGGFWTREVDAEAEALLRTGWSP